MRLYIIRHGETNLNITGNLQGHIDPPLNENGIELARKCGEKMADIDFAYAVSSPSSRAYVTAKTVLAQNKGKNVPIFTDKRLMEMAFGEWEGKCASPSNFELGIDNWSDFFLKPFEFVGCKGFEGCTKLVERANSFLDELIAKEGDTDKNILVATHGCTMRALCNRYYEDPRDFWQGLCPYNCAVNIIEVKDGVDSLIGRDVIYYDENLCKDFYKIE